MLGGSQAALWERWFVINFECISLPSQILFCSVLKCCTSGGCWNSRLESWSIRINGNVCSWNPGLVPGWSTLLVIKHFDKSTKSRWIILNNGCVYPNLSLFNRIRVHESTFRIANMCVFVCSPCYRFSDERHWHQQWRWAEIMRFQSRDSLTAWQPHPFLNFFPFFTTQYILAFDYIKDAFKF